MSPITGRAALALAVLATVAVTSCGTAAVPSGAGPGGAEPGPAGSQAGGDHHREPGQHGAPGEHHHDGEATGSGLTDVQGGYRLAEVTGPATPGRADALSFRILGPDGAAQTRFQPEQTRLMHVYVVRADLTDFDHVHPDMTPDGRWNAPVVLERPGSYRVVAEFVALDHAGLPHHRVLAADIDVPGTYTPEPIAAPAREVAVDGYVVSVTAGPAGDGPSRLLLHVTRDGTPVTELQPYLDTYAHVTGFHEGDLEAVHFHPVSEAVAGAPGGPTLEIDSEFPTPGNYRLFIQFQTAGEVHTAPVTLAVP